MPDRHLILDKLDCIKAKIELLRPKVVQAADFLDSDAERNAYYQAVNDSMELVEQFGEPACTTVTDLVVDFQELFPDNPQGED